MTHRLRTTGQGKCRGLTKSGEVIKGKVGFWDGNTPMHSIYLYDNVFMKSSATYNELIKLINELIKF